MTREGERVTAGSLLRVGSSVSLRGASNSLKMRHARGGVGERRQGESEGRTGVRGKVGVPNRGVGG